MLTQKQIEKINTISSLRRISKNEGISIPFSLYNFKEEPHKTIDWEQRRYEIAKDMMIAAEQHNNDTTGFRDTMAQAQYAIECANALIAELKKEFT